MRPWLEAGGVLLLAAVSGTAGWGFSRLRRPWWTLGYFLPLGLLLLTAYARRVDGMSMMPVLRWLATGRSAWAVGAVAASMVLITPLSRVKSPAVRRAVWAFLTVIVMACSVLPFLLPGLLRNKHLELRTTVTDGVCLQSTGYTCGPAAAVTALRALGIEDVGEGELAVLAYTGPSVGTDPELLAAAISARCTARGVSSEYRSFSSADDLRGHCPVLAVVRHSLIVDHYVTVLNAEGAELVIGDPLNGRTRMTRPDFEKLWRRVGIVVKRSGSAAASP